MIEAYLHLFYIIFMVPCNVTVFVVVILEVPHIEHIKSLVVKIDCANVQLLSNRR